jgi:ElaB/YqjD/DUF883 family membrane-anchored ribosome-binding protein
MATAAANDLDRERGTTTRNAAREAARQARAATDRELHRLISDVEDLLERIGDAADPELGRLRAKVASAVDAVKSTIASGVEQVVEQVQDQARGAWQAGDRRVHEQPWQAIGIVALASVVAGFLLGRR